MATPEPDNTFERRFLEAASALHQLDMKLCEIGMSGRLERVYRDLIQHGAETLKDIETND